MSIAQSPSSSFERPAHDDSDGSTRRQSPSLSASSPVSSAITSADPDSPRAKLEGARTGTAKEHTEGKRGAPCKSKLDRVLDKYCAIALGKGEDRHRDRDITWSLSFPEYKELQRRIQRLPAVAAWQSTKAREEYDRDTECLRLRTPMPLPVHDLFTSLLTDRLRAAFGTALNQAALELPAERPSLRELLPTATSNTRYADGSKYSPDHSLSFNDRPYPALVVECEFSNPLPHNKLFDYIWKSGGCTRTVICAHIDYLTPAERSASPGSENASEYRLQLSVVRLKDSTPEPGLSEDSAPTVRPYMHWDREPIPPSDDRILEFELLDLDEDLEGLPQRASISMRDINKDLQEAARIQHMYDNAPREWKPKKALKRKLDDCAKETGQEVTESIGKGPDSAEESGKAEVDATSTSRDVKRSRRTLAVTSDPSRG